MISIEREPQDMGPAEHCCFCCAPSRMWTTLEDREPGEQVACCESCAKSRTPDEVPSKRAWCDAERVRHPRAMWR